MRSWVDGTVLHGRDGLLPTSAPATGIGDEGLGDSVFTTILLVRGCARAWSRHLRRLSGSARSLGLGEIDLALVERAAREVAAGPLPERARLRVLWGASGTGRGHLALQLSELSPPETSVRLMTPSVQRTSSGLLEGHKSSHYAENLLAMAEARRAGAHEAVLATEAGLLSEGTGSNVFYVVDGELRTPTLASGCLPGIARELVLEVVTARECDEPISVAAGASECLLTSSTREVQPVHEWGGRVFAAPGPVTRAVQEAWRMIWDDPSESLRLT